jgi:predicted Zn-dependent protease
LWQNRDIEAAQAVVKKAILLHPKPVFAITYGQIALTKKNPDSAIKSAQMALIMRSNLPQAYKILAEAHKMKGNRWLSDHFERLAVKESNSSKNLTEPAHSVRLNNQ